MTMKEWLVKNRNSKLRFTEVKKGGWLVFEGVTNDLERVELHIGISTYRSDILCGEVVELRHFGFEYGEDYLKNVMLFIKGEEIQDRFLHYELG